MGSAEKKKYSHLRHKNVSSSEILFLKRQKTVPTLVVLFEHKSKFITYTVVSLNMTPACLPNFFYGSFLHILIQQVFLVSVGERK